MPAPQTLIQPDLPPNLLTFKKVPVPLVVMWSPEKAVLKKRITPPLPDKPTIAVVRPTLDTPIKEEKLSDLRISSTVFVTQSPSIPPSTTSPIVVHGPEAIQKVPETTSKQPDQPPPTPARVISLSDVRVPDGTVVIPMANETAAKVAPGTMIPGQLKDPAKSENGSSDSKSKDSTGKSADHTGIADSKSAVSSQSQKNGAVQQASAGRDSKPGAGSGQGKGQSQGQSLSDKTSKETGSGNATKNAAKTGTGNGPAQPNPASSAAPSQSQMVAQTSAQSGAAIGQAKGSSSGFGSGNQPSAVHISLPRDGQFGVVVVGSSIQDQYPETAELWSGRMAATVYLHVGLARSWILQYALPRLEDAAGASGHLEAPWPYEIVRPNLDVADADSEALILHGYVTKEGRFEHLELLFPSDFAQSSIVLSVLNQWQFRPAKQNGAITPVEVLLIIPSPSQ